MRTLPVHAVALAATVTLTLLLAGCVPATTSTGAGPTPGSPSGGPLFASEEEALEAAEAAYAAYLAMASAISADGGRDAERIEPFVTEDYLDRALSSFVKLAESERHVTGSTTFDSAALVYYDDLDLQIRVCLDVSGSAVLDRDGLNVTPVDRPERLPLLVLFEQSGGRLLLDGSEVDSGGTC